MSRMHRLGRRHASASAAGHAHARQLAGDRLGSPLTELDETWLDLHLADCAACRSIAAEYEADRLALRALRDHQPEAPRDLWARTAAALERESAAAGGRAPRATGRSWRSGPLVGVASGVAVIALVIGVSALSGAFVRVPTTANVPGASTPPVAVASPVTPGPTPINVGAGSVGWVGTSPDGDLAYNVTPVSQVCPADRQPDCAPVADSKSKAVHMNVRPKSISQSPVRNQAVVVGTDAQGDDFGGRPRPADRGTERDPGPDRRADGAPDRAARDCLAAGDDRAVGVGRHDPHADTDGDRRTDTRRHPDGQPDRDPRARRPPGPWPSCRASRSSANPLPSRRMVRGSRSRPGRRTARSVRTSTCGISATSSLDRSRPII